MLTLRAPRTAIAALTCLAIAAAATAGPLTPPGRPVAPTPGPEPRTPISAATTPGDADSAFRITQPGSYYLTGNITGASGKRGIEIAASNVTIDLAGFTLAGVPGSLQGIASDGFTGITVRGGHISGWGGAGIALSNGFAPLGAHLEDVHANLNAGAGITTGVGSTLTRCTARNNGGSGLFARGTSVFDACVALGNAAGGINAVDGSIVRGCTAGGNGGDGINAAGSCTITACSADSNARFGISATSRCIITGCTVVHSAEHGIRVNDTCLVAGNTCASNGLGSASGAGIYCAGGENRVERNHAHLNDIGIEVAAAGSTLVIGNSAGNNGLNYQIAAGNRYGPVLNLTAGGGAAVSGSSAPGTLTSSDPNANIAH